jgi:hypothetical protein
MPPVDDDSPAWDKECVFLDVELLAAGCHPTPFGDGPDDDAPMPANWDAPDSSWEGRNPPRTVRELPPGPNGRRFAIEPVSGGAPEEGYVPSAADLIEFSEWSASLDATRDFYDRRSIADFNRDRPDE